MKTTLHSDIGEFITQLSNQDAPFLKADAYVRTATPGAIAANITNSASESKGRKKQYVSRDAYTAGQSSEWS